VRASRLISLVLLLQSRGSMTGAELARELEVSERTVSRDVLALGAAGIPVYSDRGRAGGYRLVDGYRTRLTGMTRDEAEALFLSGLPGPLRELGLAEAMIAARLKVTAALPAELRDAAARVAARFLLDAPGWFGAKDTPPTLTTLAKATWSDHVLQVAYRRGERVVERTVQPYALVLKAGAWYLVGRVGDGLRVYKVDRFVSVRDTGETFTRDDDVDLAEFWARRAGEFERSLLAERVTVRLSPRGLRGLRHAVVRLAAQEAERSVRGEPDEDGWVTTEVPVESMEVAYHELLALGPEVEVVEPPELRARMKGAAESMRSRYS
jgi:predicted DNA-binding transcriptional regulator YafY